MKLGPRFERTIGIAPAGWQEPELQLRASGDGVTVIDSFFADYSNYDEATFQAECFYDPAGVRNAWVGFQNPALGYSQVQRLHDAGIDVPLAYQWFAFDNADGPQRAMSAAIEHASKLGIKRMCADVESSSIADPPQSISQSISQLHAVYDLIEQAGMEPWYYGAAWAHDSLLGGTTEFASRVKKVIVANYGMNDGTRSPIRNINFGGWTTCVAHQYWSLANYCGRESRDVSYLWSDAFQEEEDSMTQEEFDALAASSAYIQDIKAVADQGKAYGDELNAAVVKRFDLVKVAMGDYSEMLDAHKKVFGS